jgi:hypothetical protein
MDRFLIAETGLGNSNEIAIIQTIKPQAIIECIAGHAQFTTPHQHFSFVNIHGEAEDWTLRVHYLHHDPGSEQLSIASEGLMKRAWHYYREYMKMIDRKNLMEQR